ncbi:MAG: competence/damage-inducible protein A [Burkholderiales bacterium]|nr:competence/damage-inducible protein A [Burkholderiales bacterium]
MDPARTTAHSQRPIGAFIIGDEILSGKRQDRHLAHTIAALRARGLALSWAFYLGDDRERLEAEFRRSMSSGAVVFSFGGIGATPDDHTRQAAARAAGVPLERHAAAVALIEAQFGGSAYPKRVLMADLPRDAGLIPNPVNRVPGFSVGDHHFFPGFPDMAWPMLDWVLAECYPEWRAEPQVELAIRVSGAGESQLIDLMERVVRDHPACKLFSLPSLKPVRTIELGVRGLRDDCGPAIVALQDGVTAAGFSWERMADRE